MKVIVTKRSHRWVSNIAEHGTKRQRAKYRNTYCTLAVYDNGRRTGYCLGKYWNDNLVGELRLAREERRIGIAAPMFLYDSRYEPMWDGVRGMVGSLWTYSGEHGGTWSTRDT